MKSVIQIALPFFLAFTITGVAAQQTVKKGNEKKNYTLVKQYPGLQVMIPIGSFSETHVAGAGGDYLITLNRENDVINWAFDAGAAWYAGKKVTVSGYRYKYPSYSILHLMGGFHFYAGHFNPRLLTGPALRLYNGTVSFNIAARLEINYQAASRFSVSPVLNMMVEPGTRALWSAGINVSVEL